MGITSLKEKKNTRSCNGSIKIRSKMKRACDTILHSINVIPYANGISFGRLLMHEMFVKLPNIVKQSKQFNIRHKPNNKYKSSESMCVCAHVRPIERDTQRGSKSDDERINECESRGKYSMNKFSVVKSYFLTFKPNLMVMSTKRKRER